MCESQFRSFDFGASLDVGAWTLGFWTADRPFAKCYRSMDRHGGIAAHNINVYVCEQKTYE